MFRSVVGEGCTLSGVFFEQVSTQVHSSKIPENRVSGLSNRVSWLSNRVFGFLNRVFGFLDRVFGFKRQLLGLKSN